MIESIILAFFGCMMSIVPLFYCIMQDLGYIENVYEWDVFYTKPLKK